MQNLLRSLLIAIAFTLVAATAATAQTLAGSVRDTSGAVLPGVTVEAASAALIEKVRSVVTDANGQYQIPNVPPGVYKLTFSLTGFSAYVRDSVNVSGAGVTSINAELRVGALTESVTVTGDTPVVDVQSARQATVMDGDVVRALPASRSYGNYLAAVPAIQATGFNTGVQTTNNFFTARGGRANEGAIQIDGMNVGAPSNGGGVSGYLYDMNNSAEVQVTISGGLGEADRGGPAFNIIPKTGGNSFHGMYFGSFSGTWGQSSNIDEELRLLNFGTAPALRKNWDSNFAIGGPIWRDRIWFYANTRTQGAHLDTANLYGNKNAGDPTKWTYLKDDSVRVRSTISKILNGGRITSQLTPRNKVGFYLDVTQNCSGSSFVKDSDQCRSPGDGWTGAGPGIGPGVATTAPESATIWSGPARIQQVTWNSPFSGRVLLEAGYSALYSNWGDVMPQGALADFIAVTERSTNAGVPMANYQYRGWYAQPSQNQWHHTWRSSIAYVSGTHNMKFGYAGGYQTARITTRIGQQIQYIFQNGAPVELQQQVGPRRVADAIRYDALYAQDSWTRGRLTLQGALRFDLASSWSLGGENGILEDHQFGKALIFDRVEGVKGYKDLSPRVGAAYDLFGNGRTALKANFGRYMQAAYQGEAYTISNPATTLVATVNRAWTDPSGDRIAQCDFLNPVLNQECGPWLNLQWGSTVQTTRINPATLEGWNVRSHDWQVGVTLQQQLLPGTSVEVSYNRRWWGNFFTTHNAALTADDFDQVTLTAPQNSKLPGGGGYPVTFLVRNSRQATIGVSDPYFTRNQDFGDETHYWHGVDVNLSARLRGSLFVQAGTSTGRGVNDTCAIEVARFGRPQRIIDGQPTCDASEPWLTQLRGLASYTVPKIDVLLSTVFRSQPNVQPGITSVATNGASRVATMSMTPTQFLAFTGVPLRPGLATQSVDLLAPGAVYGDRVNVMDMRIAKLFRFFGKRTTVGMDGYNLFNANTPTTYESVYDVVTNGAKWMTPTAVLNARAARFNVQFDF
jgi:carboxypeptidase family protein